ncbi:MAG: alpha/beta fold hydrolase [Mariprofundaceae bacterium]|nr:alpha/beta fold hydrolase [Mariprofundaceae bacterium]
MPTLVFVHGWGQSAQVWHAQVAFFAGRLGLRTVNLPGHGGAADVPFDAWGDALLDALPDGPVVLIGWSLGGMLGMHLALQHAERLVGLVLLSSTPRFRVAPDWAYGCEDEVFERFQEVLEFDAPRLLDRFFALMLQGDELSRRQYVEIARSAVDKRHPVSLQGWRCGLQWLDTRDLRAELAQIKLPTLIIHGESDAVTPVGAARYMVQAIPGADLQVMQGGHALHLSCAQQLNETLEEWCLNSISTHDR